MNNLEAENARLREAIKYYDGPLSLDKGKRARAALSPPSAREHSARLTKAIRDALWECPQIAVVGVNFQEREHSRAKAIECIANAVRAALSPPSVSEPDPVEAMRAKCESLKLPLAKNDFERGRNCGLELTIAALSPPSASEQSSEGQRSETSWYDSQGPQIARSTPSVAGEQVDAPALPSARVVGSPDAWRG